MGAWNCPNLLTKSGWRSVPITDHSSSFHGGDFISIALWKIKLQAQVDQLACIKADQNNKCQQHWRSPSRCCVMATNVSDSDNETSSAISKTRWFALVSLVRVLMRFTNRESLEYAYRLVVDVAQDGTLLGASMKWSSAHMKWLDTVQLEWYRVALWDSSSFVHRLCD